MMVPLGQVHGRHAKAPNLLRRRRTHHDRHQPDHETHQGVHSAMARDIRMAQNQNSKSKQQEANISTVKNLATKKCGRPGHPMTHLVLRAREPGRLESKISDIKKKVK